MCSPRRALLRLFAMAASQAILAQALPATSSVACSSGVSQRKSVSTILVAPFKGSVAGLRWESQQAKVLFLSLSSVGAIVADPSIY